MKSHSNCGIACRPASTTRFSPLQRQCVDLNEHSSTLRLASSSHTTRSHSLSLSHFIIIIKSFLFSFLLNDFILFILIMFCYNLTESNITLHIFFDTSEIIFLNWRDEKTNQNKRKQKQIYCIYFLFLKLNEFLRL
jgi:hypothetical protein